MSSIVTTELSRESHEILVIPWRFDHIYRASMTSAIDRAFELARAQTVTQQAQA